MCPKIGPDTETTETPIQVYRPTLRSQNLGVMDWVPVGVVVRVPCVNAVYFFCAQLETGAITVFKEMKTSELLDEDTIGEYYRWCPTDDMKADLLTKKSAKAERLAWFRELHMVRIRSKKPKKEKSPFAPNRPRPTLPMRTLRELSAEALGLL